MNQNELYQRANDLISDAISSGFVVRIDLVNGRPPAMGNYRMVAEVYPRNTGTPQAPVPVASTSHDNVRDQIGQVISKMITEAGDKPDWFDSRNIDVIADAVLAELLNSVLIDALVYANGAPISYEKAVEISAIITKMPEEERIRLLSLGDGGGCPCEPSGSDGRKCPDANGRLLCERPLPVSGPRTNEPNAGEFPKLMQCVSAPFIIYVNRLLNGAAGTGIVVASQSELTPLGTVSDSWDLSQFTDYSGTVAINNGRAPGTMSTY